MLKNLDNIISNHFLSLVCSLVYFLLGGTLLAILLGNQIGFLIAFIIYILSVLLAISTPAEKLFRFLHNIRSIETNEERDYLIPIFEDVLSAIPQDEPFNKEKIEICIIDKMDINACAIGNTTIAVTKGAMKAFDEEQLKGVIAHEIAHIRNFDTIANMFMFIASGYFYLFTLLLQFLISLTERPTSDKKEESARYFLGSFIRIFLYAFSFFVQIVLAIESRKKEYRADETAYDWGFGEELISALYLLEKISLGDYSNLKQKITASHPRTTTRIGRLESMVYYE